MGAYSVVVTDDRDRGAARCQESDSTIGGALGSEPAVERVVCPA